MIERPRLASRWPGSGLPIFTARATAALAAACASVDRVLLPALYCAEVVEAITARGVSVGYYDLNVDLSPPVEPLLRALTPDVGAVVWHHPFGRHHPLPTLPDGITVIEDACVALRTFHALDVGASGAAVIFSLRKEFGWTDGAAVIGRHVDRVVPVEEERVRTAALDLDLDDQVRLGRVATEQARDVLGERLVASGPDETLTWLPVLSADRDAAVAALRAAGIEAWYWREPLPGLAVADAPVAHTLWQDLLLMPPLAEHERWRYERLRLRAWAS